MKSLSLGAGHFVGLICSREGLDENEMNIYLNCVFVLFLFCFFAWLFLLTPCRVSENKRIRIVRVLMFPVAALIMKSFTLLSSIEKFIA